MAHELYLLSYILNLLQKEVLKFFNEPTLSKDIISDSEYIEEVVNCQNSDDYIKWIEDNTVDNWLHSLIKEGPRDFEMGDKNCLNIIGVDCHNLASITAECINIKLDSSTNEITQKKLDLLKNMDSSFHSAVTHGCIAYGYWSAKMIERNRNMKNVRPTTERRLKNIAFLKEESEKDKIDLNKKIPVKFITKIMSSKMITERVVKGMIDEIRQNIE